MINRDILVNPKTKRLLDAYKTKPVGALIVHGGQYSGLEMIVSRLCSQLLGNDSKNQILRLSSIEGKQISIDQVRQLKKSLRTSVTTASKVGRVVVIEGLDTMTAEAQNALLKLIEEPVSKTALLLQTHSLKGILATITSRCQSVEVLPITKEQAQIYASIVTSTQASTSCERAYLLSKGEVVLFNALINGEDTKVMESINNAKKFMSLSVFDRLQLQKDYSASDKLVELLSGLERISEAAMHVAEHSGINRWKRSIEVTKKCKQLLDANVTKKLIYLKLCIML